jgi:hypothetical protein
MYNIVEQIISFRNTSFVGEEGLTSVEPTHLLLTKEQYKVILKSVGINSDNMPKEMNTLYGLKVVYSDSPLESPRVIYLE